MVERPTQFPPGPTEKYDTSEDLLGWMMDNLKEFGDVYKASIYGTSVYVVSDPLYAHYVLRENWRNYKKGQAIKRIGFLLGNGLMVSEGEFWKTQRRMIQPAFHHEAMSALTSLFTKANLALLANWKCAAQKQSCVNVTRDISQMVLKVVLVAIFSDDYEKVASHFSILSSESARNLQFAQAFRPLRDSIAEVVSERRKDCRRSTDLLGMLMEARDRESGQGMTDRQLFTEIMTLIVAGHETTASTLTWVWYLLSLHPETEEKLSVELKKSVGSEFGLDDLQKFPYTRQIIEETMRLYPPGWLMTRTAMKDDWFGGYFVPAGTEIYISPYMIQRHPALWISPDSFDPHRFDPDRSKGRNPLAMIPFSAGPRKCIGELFARIEMQIHLMTIAKQLRLRLVGAQSMELDLGVNLRSKYDLTMAPEIKTLPYCQTDLHSNLRVLS